MAHTTHTTAEHRAPGVTVADSSIGLRSRHGSGADHGSMSAAIGGNSDSREPHDERR